MVFKEKVGLFVFLLSFDCFFHVFIDFEALLIIFVVFYPIGGGLGVLEVFDVTLKIFGIFSL